jgi:hypothetical protein
MESREGIDHDQEGSMEMKEAGGLLALRMLGTIEEASYPSSVGKLTPAYLGFGEELDGFATARVEFFD